MIKYDKEHIDYFNSTERTIMYSDENKKAISVTYTFSIPQDMDKLINPPSNSAVKPIMRKTKSIKQGKVFKV